MSEVVSAAEAGAVVPLGAMSEEHFYVLRFDDTEEVKVVKSPAPVLVAAPEFFYEEALRIMGINDPFNCDFQVAFYRKGEVIKVVGTAQALRRYVRRQRVSGQNG